MKIVLLGDVHYGIRNDNKILFDYFKKFFDNVLFPYMEKERITTLIQLGDLVDRRKYINYLTSSRLRQDFLQPLEDKNIDTFIICGNHDVFYKSTNEINSLKELIGDNERYPSIRVFDKSHTFSFDGLNIDFIPWMNDTNQEETLKYISDSKSQIMVGHLELEGFEMFRGSVCDHGMDKSIFKKYDMVFSGHFHHISQKDNIHYLGAFSEFTWSDYQDPRGFHVFDTETRELTFHQNPYSIHHRFVYSDIDKELIDVLKYDFNLFQDKFCKVVVRNKSNPQWFDMFMERVEKVNPISVQVIDETVNFELGEEEVMLETESTLDLLLKYSKNFDNKVEGLDKFISSLYNESLSIER